MRRILHVGGVQLEQFIKGFVRDSDGSWICIERAFWGGPPVMAVTPGTRFTPGTIIAGVEPTQLLDEQYQKQGRRSY
jgi:hypothetical protein